MSPRTGPFARIEEDDPRVVRLRGACEAGKCLKEAAAIAGFSYSSAYAMAKRFGIAFKRRKVRGMALSLRQPHIVPRPAAPQGHGGDHLGGEDLRSHYTGVKANLSRWH